MSKRYYCPNRAVTNTTKLLGDRSYYDIEPIVRNRLQAAPQFIKRLELDAVLEGHNGCVNCLEWTSNGRFLASASDDYRVILWDPFKRKQVLNFLTPHHGNIFSVKFLPHTGDSEIATGAADGQIYVFDVNRSTDITPKWKCTCHYSRVKRLATANETPSVFWSAGEDGNILQFDIREPHKCRTDNKVLLVGLQNHIGLNAEAKCIAVNQRRPEQIAVGANDVYARVYDRRMITLTQITYKSHDEFLDMINLDWQGNDNLPQNCVTYYCPGHLNKLKDRKSGFSKAITYLTFSSDGTELLVNMGGEQIYLYDLYNAKQPVYLSMPQFRKATDEQDDDGANTSSSCAQTTSTASTVTYTKSSKLPESVDARKRAGNDFLENEKYLQAIDEYTTAISIIPNHPVFYLNRATAYMRRNWFGDIYAGLRDCQTALKLDPTYVKAHFRLARALFELGYVVEASECLDELKKRFPSHSNNNGVAMLTKDIQNNIEQNKIDIQNMNESPNSEFSEKEMHWRTLALDYSERFVGHCNTTTDIKEANFFGSDGKFVIAGSDDCHFFIWERPTNIITNVYKGDTAIVNCVQPNPFCCMLATSGIDHEVRIWCPKPEENFEPENKLAYYDGTVNVNQHRMQADPFDISSSGTICRSS